MKYYFIWYVQVLGTENMVFYVFNITSFSQNLLYITFYHLFLDLSEFSLIFEGRNLSSLNFESLLTPIIFLDPE